MLVRYILLTVGIVFLLAALTRGPRTIQGRTWLVIAAIFGLVSAWLFVRG